MAHDLDQQVSYLRAALEQEKKPLGFLIGAGAPMSIQVNGSPLVPDLEELTKRVRADIKPEHVPAIDLLSGHLSADDAKSLEALLNYVRSLAALPGSQDVRGITVDELSKLDAEICRVVRKHVDQVLPDDETPYFSLALWIGAVQRLLPVQLFTTNYDLLVEQALERQRVAYFDGFVGSREPSFDLQAIEEDQLPNRWTLLWKLHGSINWSQDAHGHVVRRPADADDESSALVYPSHLKYDQSRRLPYLAMMDRLKSFLKLPGAVLVTSGFSFRDQHINEVIDQALRANQTANVQGLLYGPIANYGDGVALAKSLPNLTLIAKDAAVVGSVSSPWAPQTDAKMGLEIASSCDLGDFVAFGNLLRGLVGEGAHKDLADA